MSALVVIVVAIAIVRLYPSPWTIRGVASDDATRSVAKMYTAELVTWAVVSVAAVAGLVAWAVMR